MAKPAIRGARILREGNFVLPRCFGFLLSSAPSSKTSGKGYWKLELYISRRHKMLFILYGDFSLQSLNYYLTCETLQLMIRMERWPQRPQIVNLLSWIKQGLCAFKEWRVLVPRQIRLQDLSCKSRPPSDGSKMLQFMHLVVSIFFVAV